MDESDKKNHKNTHPSVSICQDDDNKALCSLQCVIVASPPWLSRSVTFSLSKVDGVSAWGSGAAS